MLCSSVVVQCISQEQIKIKIELHSHYILNAILRIFNGLNVEFRAHNKSGKSGWEGGSVALEIRVGGGVCGLGNLGGGRGLEVQEIRKEGGVKNSCHPSGGGVDFFWNNPLPAPLF